MKAQGKVYKYGDNIDTDIIIPARYLNTTDSKELASHCMEPVDENFGCGSSREHAPIAIKACGVSCVIAKSFARIFYRNAINIGLAIMECPEAAENIEQGDEVSVDFETGVITNITRKQEYKAMPFPEFIDNIIKKGGLLNSIK